MTFDEAVEIVLDIEQGYVFDPNDPGGETNWGISKRAHPNVDIKNLTRDGAKAIYLNHYWLPLKPLLIPAHLRLCLFDCAVNQGVETSIRLLQSAVGLKPDGIIGPMTLAAADSYSRRRALRNLLMARHERYTKNPRWNIYGAGWSKRLIEIAMESARVS